LFLAGDWTATGWPATMEGAVRSGYLAAEAVLRSAGTPRRFLQPDLSPDGFISMWLGKPS
jgi:zeta-carotene desaturase